eukprot:11301665-Ditylum_brightwellii.AAC.1
MLIAISVEIQGRLDCATGHRYISSSGRSMSKKRCGTNLVHTRNTVINEGTQTAVSLESKYGLNKAQHSKLMYYSTV